MTNPNNQKRENIFKHLKEFNKDKDTTKLFFDLTADEAKALLMTSAHYHNFELPEYFNFDNVLNHVQNTVGDRPYTECLHQSIDINRCHGVNIDILLNKDGHYAVRPLTLCNPYLYYFMVRTLCTPEAWQSISQNLNACQVPHIMAGGLPVVPAKVEKFHNSTIIFNWWRNMEQRSLELAVDYRYMFVTDITNCYGSINPHTIDWALSRRNTQKATDSNHALANDIIKLLHGMQHGHNAGIPQGSTLFDILAEIVLSYADLLLHEALEREGITQGYEVLRYRDDYRIFCNNSNQLERISYILQQVLESLGLRMNTDKTRITDDVVTNSIKPDKLYILEHAPVIDDKQHNLQKHLLYVLQFARKFPNSGQLRSLLCRIHKRVMNGDYGEKLTHVLTVNLMDEDSTTSKTAEDNLPDIITIIGNADAMAAIALQIAIENMPVAHYALRIIGDIVSYTQAHKMGTFENHDDLLLRIRQRLINMPNADYLKLWLQSLTNELDKANNTPSPYDTPLCRLVAGLQTELWNNSWLVPALASSLPVQSVVNKDAIPQESKITINENSTNFYDAIEDALNSL